MNDKHFDIDYINNLVSIINPDAVEPIPFEKFQKFVSIASADKDYFRAITVIPLVQKLDEKLATIGSKLDAAFDRIEDRG